MAKNLGLALAELFGRDTITRAGLTDLLASPEELATLEAVADGSAMAPTATPSTVEELIIAANRHYQLAQQYIQQGDWAKYGAEMDALEQTIAQLVAASGVQIDAPTAADAAAPEPAATPATADAPAGEAAP
jgi:uncharacterized membrane protein (UPF0182 family)